MKTTFLAFFLFLALSTAVPSTTADFVYDTDGFPLLNGGIYFIVPASQGNVGGLELGITGDETCPLTVVQAPSLSAGLPASLSSPVLLAFIGELTPLNIAFIDLHTCIPQPSAWDVVDGVSVKQVNAERPVGPFKIQKYQSGPHDYKIVYCSLDGTCKDLGIVDRTLVVSEGNPFIVNFKKRPL